MGEASIEPTSGPRVDQESFRDVIGRFASGVTVITTTADHADQGATASAVTSLSLDPPMLLVCLNRDSSTRCAILDTGRFGVSILRADQDLIARQFATSSGSAKFDGVPLTRSATGLPLIADAIGHIECEVAETVTGGTHTVFMGRVTSVHGTEGQPLAYFRGSFGRLESVLDEEAYRGLRAQIIQRRLGAESRLHIDTVARDLETQPAHVYYALIKLTADGLVTRDDDGYSVRPLTASAAADLFGARCAIELGVVDRTVNTAAPEAVAALDALARSLAHIVSSPRPDLDAFLNVSHTFHKRLVGLAECDSLSECYDRLGIPAFWTVAMTDQPWWRHVDVVHHRRLVEAYQTHRADHARQLVREHAEITTQLAAAMIATAGGRI